MIQRNTYDHVYTTWLKINRIDISTPSTYKLRTTVTRSFFAGESGCADSPPAKFESIGKKRTIKQVDGMGILLTDKHWYPFFVLTLLKPLNKKKVDD
jgi:hypothetical protein